MSRHEALLLRLDPKVLDALRRWAADDLRSVNAHIEFLLRRALKDAGRAPTVPNSSTSEDGNQDSPE